MAPSPHFFWNCNLPGMFSWEFAFVSFSKALKTFLVPVLPEFVGAPCLKKLNYSWATCSWSFIHSNLHASKHKSLTLPHYFDYLTNFEKKFCFSFYCFLLSIKKKRKIQTKLDHASKFNYKCLFNYIYIFYELYEIGFYF